MQKNLMNVPNDTFSTSKKSLFRKADQLVRNCNTDVFVVLHNKNIDEIFSYTSDNSFDLVKISELLLREVIQGRYQNNTDILKLSRNIE